MWFNFVAALYSPRDITMMACANSLDHQRQLPCGFLENQTDVCYLSSIKLFLTSADTQPFCTFCSNGHVGYVSGGQLQRGETNKKHIF